MIITSFPHTTHPHPVQGGPEVAKFCAEHVTDVLQGTEGTSVFCGRCLSRFDGHVTSSLSPGCHRRYAKNLTAFKRGEWEGALAHSFLALDRHVAGEEGQRVLGQLARAEREKAREQVGGRR